MCVFYSLQLRLGVNVNVNAATFCSIYAEKFENRPAIDDVLIYNPERPIVLKIWYIFEIYFMFSQVVTCENGSK